MRTSSPMKWLSAGLLIAAVGGVFHSLPGQDTPVLSSNDQVRLRTFGKLVKVGSPEVPNIYSSTRSRYLVDPESRLLTIFVYARPVSGKEVAEYRFSWTVGEDVDQVRVQGMDDPQVLDAHYSEPFRFAEGVEFAGRRVLLTAKGLPSDLYWGGLRLEVLDPAQGWTTVWGTGLWFAVP